MQSLNSSKDEIVKRATKPISAKMKIFDMFKSRKLNFFRGFPQCLHRFFLK